MKGRRALFPLFLLVLFWSVPEAALGQTDTLMLRYKPQTEVLQYHVEIVTQAQGFDVRHDTRGRPTTTHFIIPDLQLSLSEAENGEIAGRYVFGQTETRSRSGSRFGAESGSQGWSLGKSRDTTFQIGTTGAMERSRVRA